MMINCYLIKWKCVNNTHKFKQMMLHSIYRKFEGMKEKKKQQHIFSLHCDNYDGDDENIIQLNVCDDDDAPKCI